MGKPRNTIKYVYIQSIYRLTLGNYLRRLPHLPSCVFGPIAEASKSSWRLPMISTDEADFEDLTLRTASSSLRCLSRVAPGAFGGS